MFRSRGPGPPLRFEVAPFDPALGAVVGGGFFVADPVSQRQRSPWYRLAGQQFGRALAQAVAGDKLRHNNDMKTCQSGADAMRAGPGTQPDSTPAET